MVAGEEPAASLAVGSGRLHRKFGLEREGEEERVQEKQKLTRSAMEWSGRPEEVGSDRSELGRRRPQRGKNHSIRWIGSFPERDTLRGEKGG